MRYVADGDKGYVRLIQSPTNDAVNDITISSGDTGAAASNKDGTGSVLTAGEKVVVAAARMSTNRGLKGDDSDLKLLEYLYRNQHTSPFEMTNVTVDIHAPLFVITHFLRHRTGKFNQFSARYSTFTNEDYYYPPLNAERQFTEQQRELFVEASESLVGIYGIYQKMLDAGVSSEIARFCLPQSQYSTLRMQFDLSNLLKLLTLRCDSHAQLETRQYANAIVELVRPHYPNIFRLWDERRESVVLSPAEIQALRSGTDLQTTSASQKAEWEKKKKLLTAVN